MRKIFLLRGVCASGKSSWVKENNLEPYTISSDVVRLLLCSPELKTDGTFAITQKNDKLVWEFIHNTLDRRMANGELLIVDATHYKNSLLQTYKGLIDKYKYRAYVVDFSDVPLEELLKRNRSRKEYQQVPDEVIEQMYKVIHTKSEVSHKFTTLSPEQALKEINEIQTRDCNEYDKIVFIGDIHGCYSPLKEYFDNNPFNDKNLYVFVGDYIDRGIENAQVIQFLLGIYDKKNVVLLTGNHEYWLEKYCSKQYKEFNFENDNDKKIVKKYINPNTIKDLFRDNIKSEEFLNNTVKEINPFSHSELRHLCRKFGQCANISFNGKLYCVTHTGLPIIPCAKVSTVTMTKDCGAYADINKIYETWEETQDVNTVLVHGHRNIQEYPLQVKENIFNLCDTVEFGGNLRILEVSRDEVKPILIKNNVFRPIEVKQEPDTEDKDIFDLLQKSKLVFTKKLVDNVVSFNFTNDAFKKSAWNDLTVKARGLFVDLDTRTIVSRSYSKFFNFNERRETTIEGICENITFPVHTYKKENGFLGIVSLYKDKLFVCSKSTNTGEFAQLMRDTLLETLGRKGVKELKNLLRTTLKNKSLVFECINLKDKHIIDYDHNEVVLLDVFDNTLEENRLPIEQLSEVSLTIGCRMKTSSQILVNKAELIEWINKTLEDTTIRHEGYVVVGDNGFKFKIKSDYYKFWKSLRGILQRLQRGRNIDKKMLSRKHVEVVQFMEQLGREELQDKCIIDIRNLMEKAEVQHA